MRKKTSNEPLIKSRGEVADADKWNVSAFYPSFADWKREFDALKAAKKPPLFPELLPFQGHLQENPALFVEAVITILSIERKLDKLFTYAHLRHDEDITNEESKSYFEEISSLINEFNQEKAFFEPELLALSAEKLESYLNAKELAPYRFYIEKIVRMRPHTLSKNEEEILALASKPLGASQKAFSSLNNADFKFSKIRDSEGKLNPLTHGLYSLYLRSPDRELRKNSFTTLHSKYLKYENTLAELISGEIDAGIFFRKARHFSSSLQAALFPWAIPEKVYTNLIESVHSNLGSLHGYVSLKKKLLNLPDIHFYDMYVPVVGDLDWQVTKEEAISLVIEAMEPLGAEYQDTLAKGLTNERWVDWEESKNKRSGAYSSGCYDSFPYILMNFRGTLRDLFTLAHEAGHSMHSHLSKSHLSYHDFRYPIFVAEIASTLNEELLMAHLLKTRQKREEKLLLLNEKIEDLRATLFRQTLFAEFELELNRMAEASLPLLPSKLKSMYLNLNRTYYGSDFTIDNVLGIEWARIPHFYYHFYVYQYATGISAASALAEHVLAGERDRYLTFLKSGGSAYPIELLKRAGVDLNEPAPINAACKKFDGYVKELEQLATV